MIIKSHPGEGLLYQYAAGDLSAAMTLVVGTHIDMCKACRQTVCEIEQKLCEENLDTLVSVASTTMSKSQCDQMLEAIFASSACNKQTRQPNEILSLEGRRFTLPRTLAHNSHRIGEWSKLVGKLWRAPLTLDNGNQTNLIWRPVQKCLSIRTKVRKRHWSLMAFLTMRKMNTEMVILFCWIQAERIHRRHRMKIA